MVLQIQNVKQKTEPTVTWNALPADFILPDEPVENIQQPILAAALTDALGASGLIKPKMLIGSNFGLVATVNKKIIVKAPYWVYVPQVQPLEQCVIRRSYTPHLEVRCLHNGQYQLMPAMENGRYWIPELELFLVIWHGERLGQTINWLRWCDRQGNILLWSSEQTEPERQRVEPERQRAEPERQRAEPERQRAEPVSFPKGG